MEHIWSSITTLDARRAVRKMAGGVRRLVVASTIAVASVSWIALERPLNQLKRLVPYATDA
jgi:hypothetical protein